MSMRFSIELTDRDLQFFREALKKSREAVKDADDAEILEAISDVLVEIKSAEPLPDFVAKRIPQLESMIHMLQDDEWRLPEEDREKLLATFVYFADPEDILPDTKSLEQATTLQCAVIASIARDNNYTKE